MLLSSLNIQGANPFYSQESTGGPNFPDLAFVDDVANKAFPFAQVKPGTLVEDRYGNIYMYVRMAGTFVEGTVCKLRGNATGTIITADSTGDNIHVFKTNITAQTGVDSEKDNYLEILNAATCTRSIFKILGNTSGANSYITVSKKDLRFGRGGFDGNRNQVAGSDTVVANAVVAHIYRPYDVIPTAAAADIPVGVAQGAVATGDYGLMIVQGYGKVLMVANTDNWVENQLITTSGTAGAAKGQANGGLSVQDIVGKIGIAKIPSSAAAATGNVGPAIVQLLGKL